MTNETSIFKPKHYLQNTKTKKVYLISKPTVFGRKDSDVIIKDSNISSKHCLFTPQGIALGIKDLGSTNGTYINRKRMMDEEQILKPNDLVQIGHSYFTYTETMPADDEIVPFEELSASQQFAELFNVSYMRWIGYFFAVLVWWMGTAMSKYMDDTKFPADIAFLQAMLDPEPSKNIIYLLRALYLIVPILGHSYLCKRWLTAKKLPSVHKMLNLASYFAFLLFMLVGPLLIRAFSSKKNFSIKSFATSRSKILEKSFPRSAGKDLKEYADKYEDLYSGLKKINKPQEAELLKEVVVNDLKALPERFPQHRKALFELVDECFSKTDIKLTEPINI